MKSIAAVCLWALLLGAQAIRLQDAVSPVTRVVKLLQDLSKQIETEGKAEEELYESFVCWGKSVVEQKSEANTAAQSRADSLETYLADLEAGKIELTSERQDLEKEIEELSADLEADRAVRDKEKKDFESAKGEMKQAIAALDSAIKVLTEATKENKASLMSFKSRLNGGLAAVEAESKNLDKAVELGERFLTKADSVFLSRLLTGNVPERDENMLRKKADFKKSYKARSGKIQDVLARLHGTFTNNLKSAVDKEEEAQATYDKLSKSKNDQLKASQDALKKQEVENGARGMSKANAKDEIESLKKQIKNDEKFIKDTQESLKQKKKEWDERSKLRDGELSAIGKAISILYNDDARDTFKKTFSLIQRDSRSKEAAATFSMAATELRKIAMRTGDRRLSALAEIAAETAADPSAKEKFKPVLQAVDKMLAVLKSEEKTDLETKETCEQDRMKDSRTALLAGREMDEQTDTIRKLVEEIKDIKGQIENLESEKKKAKEELDAAAAMRKKENLQYKVTEKEDQEAADTVKSAKEVLAKHYQEAFKASLVQQKKPAVVDGKAPPPPPTTWDGSYGGKKGESTGIIAMLEMVHADILKDKKKAKAEEDEAQSEFDKLKSDTEAQMKELGEQITKMTGTKGKKETDKTDTIKERTTKKGEWDAVMKKMQDAAPNCEYYAVNYDIRVKNRQIEVDGLNKAKAILQGASFK